jgi:hypothetical protein
VFAPSDLETTVVESETLERRRLVEREGTLRVDERDEALRTDSD